MNHKIKMNLAGWIGLVMAVIVGGAISETVAFVAGAGWIFLCLFDSKRGGW
jgi:hypothetical protein